MGKIRATLYTCDNPECEVQQVHTTATPARGFHLTGARFQLPDGSWKIGKLYACSAECLAKAVDAAAKKAVLADPEGQGA